MVKEKCYAKINLILNILYKRPDDFHEVDFIMATLDLYDEIIIEIAEQTTVHCTNLDLDINSNLAYKAYILLKNDFPKIGEVKITINKNIPMAAGMAGGSADAAGVLRGLNRLYDLKLSFKDLEKYALELGSDVPFCLYQKTLRARGRGEILTEVNLDFSGMNILVINPGFEMSTKTVYENHIIQPKNDNLDKLFIAGTPKEKINCFHNDLQITSLLLDERLEFLFNKLSSYDDVKVMLSGSGPTLLLFSESESKLKEIYEYYKDKYEVVKLCKVRI